MTNAELLASLESRHQADSQAIIKLRELIANETRFTADAKTTMEAEIQATIGASQVEADKLPDYRAQAVTPR